MAQQERQERFIELLAQVAREITRRQSSDVCCGDLTLEQFQTLAAVSAAEPSSIGSLSDRLCVDLSTMSRNVTVLERKGHLRRARSDDDARVVHVQLTAKGKRSLTTLRCDQRDVFKDVYGRLAAADRSLVVKALEALRASLTEADPPAGDCCAPVLLGRKSPS
jgi:DNA-binding MarR family transcriptional regulator